MGGYLQAIDHQSPEFLMLYCGCFYALEFDFAERVVDFELAEGEVVGLDGEAVLLEEG